MVARYLKELFFVLSLVLIVSCGKEETTVTQSSSGDNGSLDYVITVVFANNGLGDRGFSDNIFSGICAIREENIYNEHLRIVYFVPKNDEEARSYIDQWFGDSLSRMHRLLIVGSEAMSNYTINRYNRPMPKNMSILLLDTYLNSDYFYTRNISLYGPAHVAGQLVNYYIGEDVAVVLANQEDHQLAEVSLGFITGFNLHAETDFSTENIYYLSNQSNSGYDMADSLYRLCYKLDEKGYRFIVPICGGSAQGVYSYLRKFDVNDSSEVSHFATCGIDADQQDYSDRVCFSILKDYAFVIEQFVSQWLQGDTIPRYMDMGILDGRAQVVISDWVLLDDDFSADFLLESIDNAIEAENELFSSRMEDRNAE